MKTTQKHFDLFVKECKMWKEKLGLSHWDIIYTWEDLDKYGIDCACNEVFDDSHAFVKLDTDFQTEPPTDENIKSAARHEMIHILVGRFQMICERRYVTKQEYRDSLEDLIRRLERLIK